MLKFNPVTRENGDCIAVGRAAVAIYLILLYGNIPKGKVIVPANICYAAVLPIIYAGFSPVFCDVDRYSGNVKLCNIINVYDDCIVAGIIPHMYGNPVKELLKIKKFFVEKKIVLIEDCASLMTREGDLYVPGTIGDYVIYSTGYSKTIDIGFGGILYSAIHSLENIEKMEKRLPLYKDDFQHEWSLFSKIYRVIRNNKKKLKIANDFYASSILSLREAYIFSIGQYQKDMVFESISDLDDVISIRRNKYKLFINNLNNDIIKEKLYQYESISVPWRFNLLLDDRREEFIEYCLKMNLPISDWYPCVVSIFGERRIFKNALFHEKMIVNFPLLIPDEQIFSICNNINYFYKERDLTK